MKKIISTLGAVALTATAAHAGGIERSGQSAAILFEKGNFVEFSFGRISPSVSGVGTVFSGTLGASSGNMAKNYLQIGGGLKYQINDNLDAAIIIDQPFGADVNYPTSGYALTGSTAELNAFSVTGLLKYKTASNISVYGGLRYQTLEATAALTSGYTVNGKKDGGVGYVIGVAYEKPEIALRVALTYNSKIKHEIATAENISSPSTTVVNTPQSVNLEFQSGVAANTLVFGSIRWVEWSKFDITPIVYLGATGGSLVSYAKNTITYNIGVGRKLNDNWAVSASVGYEKASGGFSSNLGPTDGKKSLTLGAVYTRDNMKITGGVSYVKIGNAQTTFNNINAASNFTGNKAVGVGVKIGYSF